MFLWLSAAVTGGKRKKSGILGRLDKTGRVVIYRCLAKYMNVFMNITKALSDETRVRMLAALRNGESCVCQITELFGFAPSTVSKHLSILHQSGLVESRKVERWVFYRLPGRADMSKQVRLAIDFANKSLATETQIVEDAKRLKEILKIDPTILCKRQCPK